MASLPGIFNLQEFTDSGDPAALYRLYTYAPGTTTHKAIYTDAAETTPHAYTSDGLGGLYIALNARGELPAPPYLSAGGYDFVLKNSTGATVRPARRVAGSGDASAASDASLRADLASAADAAKGAGLSGWDRSKAYPPDTAGWALNKNTIPNVLEFGADTTGVADSTAAFDAAQKFYGTGYLDPRPLRIPAGTYKLNGWVPYRGVVMVTDGHNCTYIQQANAGTPAIDVNATVLTNQGAGFYIGGFTVFGAASATVAAVKARCIPPYAIWKSTFDFWAKNTFTAFETDGNGALFRCKIIINSETSSGPAVVLKGGVYNDVDLFLTQCEDFALDDQSGACHVRVVADSAIKTSGQYSVYEKLSVEYIWSTTKTFVNALTCSGEGTTFNTPNFNLDTTASGRITGALIQPFKGNVFINPQIIMPGPSGGVADPFASSSSEFTIIGPGRNQCTNKLESIYDGSNADRSLRRINVIGLDSTFTSLPNERNWESIQYLAPTVPFNFQINSNTDIVILEPSGTIATANVSFLGAFTPFDGQRWTITTTQTITSIVWAAPPSMVGNKSALPTTLAAGGKFSFVYRAATDKYYLV